MALGNKTRISKRQFFQFVVAIFLYDVTYAQETENHDSNISNNVDDATQYPTLVDYQQRLALHEARKKIRSIIVSGNKLITRASIVNALPIRIGEVFSVNATATMIKNVYKLGYFSQVKVFAKDIDDQLVDIVVVVQEKPRVKDFVFIGNKAISEKDLKDELKTESIYTILPEELKALINKLKKLYHKKNYHQAEIHASLTHDTEGLATVHFNIKEGGKTFLNRISFKGNKLFSSKKLKRALISKEDWILSMIDHSGVYNPEMVEGDKYMIEEAYKNNGFFNAKVTHVDVDLDQKQGTYHITYTVHEGDRYRIKEVNVQGNDLVGEQRIKELLPLYPGQMYSVENVRKAIENLKILWGEYGYIFADINPRVEENEADKTISVTFESDLKNQYYLNRLTIRGNKKSKDKVIRRQIFLDEGELVTNQKMEISKACVNLLGYFDQRNGVNWKMTRLDDSKVDLDLLLNEIKTGKFSANLSFGGSPINRQTPQTGLNFNTTFGDSNFLGSGIAVSGSVEISQKYRSAMGSIMNPWLFDRPIRGTASGFIKASTYDDQIDIAQEAPEEHAVGGIFGLGYVTKKFGGIAMDGKVNIEHITYADKVKAKMALGASDRFIAQLLLDKYFREGNQISFVATFGQDRRNGLAFPTNGYQWNLMAQWTVPGWHFTRPEEKSACTQATQPISNNFNYVKTELDVSYYTPLINEHDLVLGIHGNVGYVHPFKGKDVPWRNLYHIGGPASIRGYTYGQVGPMWKTDSLGASKAMFVNVEFIVPLSSNLSTRGVVFYDGGAGWDTPYYNEFSVAARAVGLSFQKDLINNNFFYRHSVGIGVRMKSPTPLQVDFGIKLNPSKKYRDHLTEMHLSMEHSF